MSYRAALPGPFVFDDVATIVENPSLRDWRTAFSPPADRGLPVTGRPLANASFALDYALHGASPSGCRATNLALHLVNALVLFALVRRTLRSPCLRDTLRPHAERLALFATLLWAAHPLTTAAVSYVSQRTEVLMTLLFLVTLHAFARGCECHLMDDIAPGSPRNAPVDCHLMDDKGARGRRRGWQAVAVAACAAGMATKEVMVSAPLLVLLYDRTFVAGSFRAAWRARWPVHLALAATWGILAWLMLATGSRGGTAGFGMQIPPWHYALTQCDAIVHYLRLALWPAPLVFDHGGTILVERLGAVWPQALLLVALLAATLFALRRAPAPGFCGAAFFAILAPTSSFVPVADTMFEHRMYLPLAAVLAGLVAGAHRIGWRAPAVAIVFVAVSFLALTTLRNRAYASELALWQDTVRKKPENVRAHYTLGTLLRTEGRIDDALAEYETALRLNPRSAETHNNLATLLVQLGRVADALPHFETALALAPSAEAHNNYGNALMRARRATEARRQFERALALRPAFAEPLNNLGNFAAQAGDFSTAEKHYRAALALRPDLLDAALNLAHVLAQTRRPDEAVPLYERVLRARPDFPGAREGLLRAEAMRAALGK